MSRSRYSPEPSGICPPRGCSGDGCGSSEAPVRAPVEDRSAASIFPSPLAFHFLPWVLLRMKPGTLMFVVDLPSWGRWCVGSIRGHLFPSTAGVTLGAETPLLPRRSSSRRAD